MEEKGETQTVTCHKSCLRSFRNIVVHRTQYPRHEEGKTGEVVNDCEGLVAH